jgi:hypothetical protein
VVPEQCHEDDDRNWHAQQPKQYTSTESHVDLRSVLAWKLGAITRATTKGFIALPCSRMSAIAQTESLRSPPISNCGVLHHSEQISSIRVFRPYGSGARARSGFLAHLQNDGGIDMWNKLALAATLAATIVGVGHAQQATTGLGAPSQAQVLNTLPAASTTVTSYYKQNVYDPADTKIGEISDVLLGKDGKVDAFIVSVGGFLGLGEKDVAVPFSAIRTSEKNGTWYLTMNATKESLRAAHGYKYDKAKATWVPA